MESTGEFANGHAVAVREANLGIVVHRQHPCLRSPGTSVCEVRSRTEAAGVGPFCAPILTLQVGPFCAPIAIGGCPFFRASQGSGSRCITLRRGARVVLKELKEVGELS